MQKNIDISCPKCFKKFNKEDHVKEHLLLKHGLLPVTNAVGLNPFKLGCTLREATEDEMVKRIQGKRKSNKKVNSRHLLLNKRVYLEHPLVRLMLFVI